MQSTLVLATLFSAVLAQVRTGQNSVVNTAPETGTVQLQSYFQLLGQSVDTYLPTSAAEAITYTINYFGAADCPAGVLPLATLTGTVPGTAALRSNSTLVKRQTFGPAINTPLTAGTRELLSAQYILTIGGTTTTTCIAAVAAADFTTTTGTTTTATLTSGTATISGTATETVVSSQTNTVVISGSSTLTTITPTTSALSPAGTTINVNVNVTVSIGNYKPCATCELVPVHPCGFNGALKCYPYTPCHACAVVFKVCPFDAVIVSTPPTPLPVCTVNCPAPVAVCTGVQCAAAQPVGPAGPVGPCVGVNCPVAPVAPKVIQVSSASKSFVSLAAVVLMALF